MGSRNRVVGRHENEVNFMILCLDVGNSQLFGGVFDKNKLLLRFRYDTETRSSSDQLGIFFRDVLRENDIDYHKITHIAFCSVVPQLDYSLTSACIKYFDIEPFILQAGVKTGLKIQYRNTQEVGADRISNAIAAVHHYPNTNILAVDLGTATTFCAISKEKEYLGGAIMPGMRLGMQSLQNNTAKLSSVSIVRPKHSIGRSTNESIQAGLYYSQLGAIREVLERCTEENFGGKKPIVIGTGGFAHLFTKEKIFDVILPDLVLEGLIIVLRMNE